MCEAALCLVSLQIYDLETIASSEIESEQDTST